MNQFHRYNATVTRVVDGDTIDALVDLGFGIYHKQRFRMLGYDAPETHRPKTLAERMAGQAATAALKTLIDHMNVIVETEKTGKYGRYLATVWMEDTPEISVNQWMIEQGHIKQPEE